jgi:chromosome segregation ATPase
MSEEKNPNDSIFRRFGGSLANAVENILFAHEEVEETQSSPGSDQAQTSSDTKAKGITTSPSIDENLVKTILKSAEELGSVLSNFESYLKTFEGIIPDEGSRYKAAYAAANKTSPLTLKALLSAVDEQISSLKNEKADFQEGIKAKNEEAEQLKVEITHIDKKIVELKRQIQDLENSKKAKDELSRKLKENIDRATLKFEAALVAVEDLLKTKKNKLQDYLKNM